MQFDCAHGLTRVLVWNRVDDPSRLKLIDDFSLDYFVKGKIVQTYKFANAKDTYDIDIRGAGVGASDVAAASVDPQAPDQTQG